MSRELIVEAALALVREEGWDGVSTRRLALVLDCSTMPIYSSIGSMEALRVSVLARAGELLARYQAREWTENRLMDMAMGYVVFARQEKNLFHFLFDAAGARPMKGEKEVSHVVDSGPLAALLDMEALSRDQGQTLAFHSWVYVHGLACLVADGVMAPDDGELKKWLEFAGGAFWLATGGVST